MNEKIKAVDFSSSPDIFQINGENCFVIEYENYFSRNFVAYQSIEHDLLKCLECAKYLLNSDNPENSSIVGSWAPTIALIITYGRCFTNAKERVLSLKKSQVKKEYHNIHDLIMSFRHNYVAHAGGYGESSIGLAAFYPNHEEKKRLNIAAPICWSLSSFNKDKILGVQVVIEYLLKYVENKKNQAYKKIVEWFDSKSLDSIYELFDECNIDGSNYPDIPDVPYLIEVHFTDDFTCKLKAWPKAKYDMNKVESQFPLTSAVKKK